MVRRPAPRSRSSYTVIDRHEVARKRAAARDARAAYPVPEHIGTGFQVIEGANRLPHHVPGKVGAHEDARWTFELVLDGSPGTGLPIAPGEHGALALADGIDADGREAVPGTENAQSLVILGSLRFGVVPRCHEHPWPGTGAAGKVHERRYDKSRLALEGHLLEDMRGLLEAYEDPGVQGVRWGNSSIADRKACFVCSA